MGQRWKRLPLIVVFLLFWRTSDGFKGGAYSNAHHQWGQPSDTFSPHAVQSSMSEARVTGTLPVEEVGSTLFPNKPLKNRLKLNPLQFVKGGSSSYQSMSHAQTAPASYASASLPLPPVQWPSSSLMSSGSTIPGVASGLSLETQYAASGSGHPVSAQGESSSYPGSSTSQGSSGAVLSASSVQSVPTSVGSDCYSGVSQSLTASSLYTAGSLMSKKLDALPLGVSSQSTNAQSSPTVSTSNTQSRSGMQLATSNHVPVQGGSSSTSFSLKPQGTLGQYTPTSPTKYISSPTSSRTSYRTVSQVGSPSQTGASGLFPSRGGNYYSGLLPESQATSSQYALGYSKPISSPQSTSSQSASVLSSRKQYTSASQGSSGAQFGASTGFASQGMSSSSGGSVQSQDSSSLYCKCALSPLDVDSQTPTVHGSRKHFTSRYDTQSGSSTPFTLQGSITYDGSPQPKVTASQFAPVSHSYPSVLSPSQGIASQSTTVQVSQKRLASTYTGSSGTQAGSSTPFTLHHTAYGGSSQPRDTASQISPGSQSSYASVSLSSPQAGPSNTVQGSLKQFTSTFTGSSGTQAGTSTPFTLQGSTAYGGSPQPQDTVSPFPSGSQSSYERVSLSSPQAFAGPTRHQSSRKQFPSTFTGSSVTQAGSSTPFTLQGSTASGGSPPLQHTASQFSPGLPSSYPGLSLPSLLGVASHSNSRKQFTAASQGSSVAQFGASTGFAPESASSCYSGSVQSQDIASRFAPGSKSSYASVSLSSPQAGPSTTVQGSWKQFSSTFTGSSGAQAGSSTPFTLHRTAYGGSPQLQHTASQFSPGSLSPYASVSLSSPQGVASQSGQAYQGYSVSKSQKSQKRQPLAPRWMQIQTSDAAASQGRSSQSSPIRLSSLSSAGGSSSRISGLFVSAQGGSTSNGGSFQSQRLSTKYTPGSQLLPYDPSVAGQGTSSASASEVLSSYSSMINQNAPAPSRSSSSSRFSVKG